MNALNSAVFVVPKISTLSCSQHTQDSNVWELKHILQKQNPKQPEVTTKDGGFLDASCDFFLALP